MSKVELLLKDFTQSSVHVPTALGNENMRTPGDACACGHDDCYCPADCSCGCNAVTKSFAKANVLKVEAELGLVFGFAIVCKAAGADYYDLQGDHIPEGAMLNAATDFMVNSRAAREMHTGAAIGSVVFAFPLTSEIAKSLDIETKNTGLLVAMKPSADVLAKFRDGTYTGFSIGGEYGETEEVE